MASSKIQKSSDIETMDLVGAAIRHLDFIQMVDTCDNLHDWKVFNNALRRYEKMWLPLAAQNTECLAAPLDIEWAWHCHMLSPMSYEKDCLNLVGKRIDHLIFGKEKRQQALKRSEELWNSKFEEPFEVDYENILVDPESGKFSSSLTYDVWAAATRQKSFFYQVSLPHYRNESFLQIAFSRYCKFLFLMRSHRTVGLIPYYDIDLIWHTHQLHPESYREDSIAVLGFVLNHNDDITDRGPGSPLNENSKRTTELFESTYPGEFYAIPGVMYRGETARGHMDLISEDILQLESINNSAVQMRDSSRATGSYFLQIGEYEKVSFPDRVVKKWSPLYSANAVPGCDSYVSTHRMIHQGNDKIHLSVRVIHCPELLLSVVLVYDMDKVVAFGQLVDTEQLPTTDQIDEESIVALDSHKQQRAMLIKNDLGDWGVLTGSWERPDVDFKDEDYSEPGSLDLKLFPLASNNQRASLVIPCVNDKSEFQFDDFYVNLMTGEFRCTENIAENVVLAFSIAVLQVLCEPCIPDPMLQKYADMSMIRAAGYETLTPTNSYIMALGAERFHDLFLKGVCETGKCESSWVRRNEAHDGRKSIILKHVNVKNIVGAACGCDDGND